jgi:splicing factor 3B subunit 2
MPAAMAVIHNSNGPVANGHANGAPVKSSAAKSRSALKRMKAKARAASRSFDSSSDAGIESGSERDGEVSLSLAMDRHVSS